MNILRKISRLLGGWPSPSLLPSTQLLEASQRVFSNPELFIPSLQYGPDAGYEPFRKATAAWLSDFYSSPWSTANRICASGGASQCLACILQVYTDPIYTKTIYMVAPTYYLACRIFEDSGFAGRLKAVPEDAEGVDIDYLERCLRKDKETNDRDSTEPLKTLHPWQKWYKSIIYAVPTFSNPSGKTMSLLRRQQIVRLARKYDALVVTDDVYDQLRWSSTGSRTDILPRLVDIDHQLDGGTDRPGADGFGNTVSNGSFSKISGPGCRTGWTEATETFTYGLSQCGSSTSGGAPSQMTAAIITEMLKQGSLTTHIEEVLIPAYQRRFSLMMSAIDQYLVPLGITVDNKDAVTGRGFGQSGGGFFIWLRLPSLLIAKEFVKRAKEEENVSVASGDIFEVYGDEQSVKCGHAFRVCFAWEDEAILDEGIQRLGWVMARILLKQ